MWTMHPLRGRHRPRVERGKYARKLWFSKCWCGHCHPFNSWRAAVADALAHSEQVM